jgi:hypothetical protein
MDIARAAFTVDLTFEPCCVYYHPMTPRACYKYMCRLFRGTARGHTRPAVARRVCPRRRRSCADPAVAAGGRPGPVAHRASRHTQANRSAATGMRQSGYNLSSKSQVSCPPRPASLAVPLLRVVRACPHNTVNVISPQKDSHKWRAGPFNLASPLTPFCSQQTGRHFRRRRRSVDVEGGYGT